MKRGLFPSNFWGKFDIVHIDMSAKARTEGQERSCIEGETRT